MSENIKCRADDDDHVSMSLYAMINHRKENTPCDLKDKHAYFNNQRKLRKSTQGQDLEVAWKDGSTDWTSLEDLKRLNLVEVVEHAKSRYTDKEVAFHWWVPCLLKKREVIISAQRKEFPLQNILFSVISI